MKLISVLKKSAKKVIFSRNSVFTYDVNNQKKYLESLCTPSDSIERSYQQYRCQMKLNGALIACIFNVASFFILLFTLINSKNNMKLEKKNVDAVFVSLGIPETVIPQELREQYKNIIVLSDDSASSLDSGDKLFFKKICKRYPFSFHFLLKVYFKIKMYSAWRTAYNPKAIIVCSEYSFTSSIMTEYCNVFGIEHINVMHGEKLYYIRDSFFKFNRCYIWDEFYKELFLKLRADENQFIVSLPPSMKFSQRNVPLCVDFTFYLGLEQELEISKMKGYWKALNDLGYKVAVRPHPRYTPKGLLNKYSNIICIEDYKTLTIEESVLRTRNVVSLYSTVLNQAIHNGVNICIDDLTYPEKYVKLQELGFFCLKKPHSLLSCILEKEYVKENS